MINITVRTLSGDSEQQTLVDKDTLGVTLKTWVAENFAVDPELQQLILQTGGMLQDHSSLADQLVEDGHCLILVARSFSRVACGCEDGFVRVLNVNTGEQEWEFKHATMVLSVAWSPDRQFLATSSADGTIRLLDVAGERSCWVLDRGFAGSISWSLDGLCIAAGCSGGEVRLLDASSGEETASMDAHGGRAVNCVSWAAGKMHQLASAGTDASLHVLDTRSFLPRLAAVKTWTHSRAVLCAAWRPNGEELAAAGSEGVVLLHDVCSNGNLSEELRLNPSPSYGALRSLSWTAEGSQLAIAGKGVLLWTNPGPSGSVRKLSSPSGGMRSIACSPRDNAFAVGGDDGSVRIYDLKSSSFVQDWNLKSGRVLSIAFQV